MSSETGLSTTELRALSQVNERRSIGLLVLDWLVIFAAILMASHSYDPLIWIVAIVVVARQQHALGVLMHDACHFRLLRSKSANDFVGHWFCAAPLFFSLKTYRFLHLTHHKDPMGPGDPDLAINGGYPIEKESFKRKITRDLTGRTFTKIVKFYTAVPPNVTLESSWWARYPIPSGILFNVLLFKLIDLMAGPTAFFVFWLLPLVTLLPFMLRIRALAEHAGFEPNPDQSQNARTMLPSWQTWLMAPHNVNYHVEHHLYPSITFFRLPEAHRTLKSRGAIPADRQFSSYKEVISGLVKANSPSP